MEREKFKRKEAERVAKIRAKQRLLQSFSTGTLIPWMELAHAGNETEILLVQIGRTKLIVPTTGRENTAKAIRNALIPEEEVRFLNKKFVLKCLEENVS